MTNDEEVAWCKGLWDSLNDGAVWLVPRSGLIFEKDKKRQRLILKQRLPHHGDMPFTAKELTEQQDEEVDSARERFSQFGVDVIDRTVASPEDEEMTDAFLDSVAGKWETT